MSAVIRVILIVSNESFDYAKISGCVSVNITNIPSGDFREINKRTYFITTLQELNHGSTVEKKN